MANVTIDYILGEPLMHDHVVGDISDISTTYVPYTGATTDVDLGANSLATVSITSNSVSAVSSAVSAGSNLTLSAGDSGGSNDGKSATLTGGDATSSGAGGNTIIKSGSGAGTNKNAGEIRFQSGTPTGSGTSGIYSFLNVATGKTAILDVSNIATSNRTFTFPDTTGTFALTSDLASYLTLDQTTPQTILNDTFKLDTLKSKGVLGTDADGKIIEGSAGGNPEGTAVLSTGEGGGTKFLREDGDGTCSWQSAGGGAPGGSTTQLQYNNAGSFGGTARGTYATSGDIFTFTAGAVADIPLVLKGVASQSGNLTEWQDNNGSNVAYMSAGGKIHVDSISVEGFAQGVVGFVVKSPFPQTVNILEVINTNDDEIWAVRSSGGVIHNTGGVLSGTLLDLKMSSGHTGNIFRVKQSNDQPVFVVNELGNIKLGTTGFPQIINTSITNIQFKGSGIMSFTLHNDTEGVNVFGVAAGAFTELDILSGASKDIHCFRSAGSGETPSFKVTGRRAAGTSATAEFAVGVHADKALSIFGTDHIILVEDTMIGASTAPDAVLEVHSANDEGHQAMTIDQNDQDQAFIDFQGFSAADTSLNETTLGIDQDSGAGTVAAPDHASWDCKKLIKMEIEGTAYWIPAYQPN